MGARRDLQAIATLLAAVTGVGLGTGVALAQTPRIEAMVDTRVTYTDNVDATSTDRQDEWVTEVVPSLRMSKDGGPLTGAVAAQLRGQAYARDSDRNRAYVTLNGAGTYEAWSERLFLDADARIARDNRSVLTGRPGGDSLDGDKRNETRSFGIGPRLHLRPLGNTEATLAYSHRWFDSSGDIDGRQVGRLNAVWRDPGAFGPLGWSVAYQREQARYDRSEVDDVTLESLRAQMLYAVTPSLLLGLSAGREWNDFSRNDERDATIYGAALIWRPSPRTTLNALVEDRFFGTGYRVDLSHRRARSSWNLAASRSVASSTDELVGAREDVLYRQYFDALGTIEDPVERDIEARRLVDEDLLRNPSPFISSNYYVAKTLSAGFSLVGRRDVFSVALRYGERTRLGQVFYQDVRDDLLNFDKVTTQSASASLARRLTPSTSGNVSVTLSKAEGSGAERAETERTTLGLGLTTRFGESTVGGLRYQHHRADGTGAAADYRENTVTANLGIRF